VEWLNYHHLLYFWTVAREGSVTRASEQLQLAQPTVSAQLRALEESLGERLFVRAGRRLELTDTGRIAYQYAEEIFSLGREFLDAVKDRPTGRPMRFSVGVVDVLGKFVAFRLLSPVLSLPQPVQLTCREDRPAHLLAELATHALDMVLADAPMPPGSSVRAFNHLLGECGVTVFAPRRVAAAYRRRFPESLNGAPFLLPTEQASLRRSLAQWFETKGIRPQVVAEFDDAALLQTFGAAGHGLFAGPSVIESDVVRRFDAQVVGRIEGLRERVYAISIERRLKHPAVVAVCAQARSDLFESQRGAASQD
jgi:LysR family transcriptional regulator, transcriptional activator of nhaA